MVNLKNTFAILKIIPPMDNCQLLAVSPIGSLFIKVYAKNWIYCGNILRSKQLSDCSGCFWMASSAPRVSRPFLKSSRRYLMESTRTWRRMIFTMESLLCNTGDLTAPWASRIPWISSWCRLFFNSLSVLESAIWKIETWHLNFVSCYSTIRSYVVKHYNPGNRKASDTITLKTSPPVSIKHETCLNNLLF